MLAAGVVAGVWLWREQRSPHQAGDTKTITLPGGATMEMVWCPPGSFTMGSNTGDDDEKPPHEVKLTEGFWMAKTEVTQEQWKSVMGTTVRQLRDKANPSRRIYGEGPNLPMYCVSWEDAQEFCRRAGHGLQLPTEAQWEYACRARTTGDCAGDIDQMAWYGEGRKGSTHPVGQKQANAWGLHDMHGNVWEWCADCYDRGYYAKSPVANPKGPASGGYRVLRGGSCWSDPRYCRSAGRSWDNPDLRFRLPGFRPVARQD